MLFGMESHAAFTEAAEAALGTPLEQNAQHGALQQQQQHAEPCAEQGAAPGADSDDTMDAQHQQNAPNAGVQQHEEQGVEQGSEHDTAPDSDNDDSTDGEQEGLSSPVGQH